MNKELIEDKIIDLLNNELKVQEREWVESKIQNDPHFKACFDSLRRIYKSYDENHCEIEAPDMSSEFEAMLSKYDNNKLIEGNIKNLRFTKTILRVAAVFIFLLAAGLFFMNQESPNSSDQMVSAEYQELINNESVGDRIKAVNLNHSMAQDDDKLIEVLVKTLRKDKSAHVRLASVNALGKFKENINVKDALINALEEEKDPTVQIALINILTQSKEPRAIDQFDKIIDSDEAFKFVKDEAQYGKLKLNKTY